MQSVVDYITDRHLTDVILVGHSFGGSIICKVVEAMPDRFRRLVFHAAMVLQDGESMYDASPPQYRGAMDQLVAESPDHSRWCLSLSGVTDTSVTPIYLWRGGHTISSHLNRFSPFGTLST